MPTSEPGFLRRVMLLEREAPGRGFTNFVTAIGYQRTVTAMRDVDVVQDPSVAAVNVVRVGNYSAVLRHYIFAAVFITRPHVREYVSDSCIGSGQCEIEGKIYENCRQNSTQISAGQVSAVHALLSYKIFVKSEVARILQNICKVFLLTVFQFLDFSMATSWPRVPSPSGCV
jgi:hypothetical protein